MIASDEVRSSSLSCTGSIVTVSGVASNEVPSAVSTSFCGAVKLTGYKEARSLVGLNTSRTTSKSRENDERFHRGK